MCRMWNWCSAPEIHQFQKRISLETYEGAGKLIRCILNRTERSIDDDETVILEMQ